MSTDEPQAHIEAIGDQLRAKISSKFQTSTFLAGFGFAVLTVQLSTFWQSPKFPYLLPTSISFMVASLFLYIAAVIKLDELTMPKRFWKEDPARNDSNASRLAYLTDNDLWELQKRMVFYWLYLTMVAASLTAVSLMLMLLPCSPRQMSDEIVRETFSCAVISFIFVLIYFGILYLIVLWLKSKKRWNALLRFSD